MIFKTIVVTILAIIVFSLFTALYSMFKGKGQGDAVVKALTIRIGLSISLFIMLMIGAYFGVITPHGISP
jgi:hypothetical protein